MKDKPNQRHLTGLRFAFLILPLLCLTFLCPGIKASAYESESLIHRTADESTHLWIAEMRLQNVKDAATGQSMYMQLYYNTTDKKGNPTSVKVDAQVVQTGTANYFSNHISGSGKKAKFSHVRDSLEPANTYFLVFSAPSSVTNIDEVWIGIDRYKNQGYDNVRIEYLRIFQMTSGTIGDLTLDEGGDYYRSYSNCKFSTTSYYVEDTSYFDILAGSTNPDEVRIPLKAVKADYDDYANLQKAHSYTLRLVTKEGGDYSGNIRFYIYGMASTDNYNQEIVLGTVDLDAAALAQKKPNSAHDLYGYSVLDIPFYGCAFRGAQTPFETMPISRCEITRIVIQPLGDAGTGWLPQSIAILNGRFTPIMTDSLYFHTLLYGQTAKYLTPSMPNLYVRVSDSDRRKTPYVLAWWQNDSDIACSTGNFTELRRDTNARPGCELSTYGYNGTTSIDFLPDINTFYLMFQTKDSPDAGLNLNYPNNITFEDIISHTANKHDPQQTGITLDITYRTNGPESYSDSGPAMPAVRPEIRTMRFYLIESAWHAMIQNGIRRSYALNELFSRGQTDYIPIFLPDMATGTVDDIIDIELSDTGLDTSWGLNSFAIYTEEPNLTNKDEVVNFNKGHITMHPDIAFRNYPAVYYAPPEGIQLLTSSSVSFAVGESLELIKPGENLEGYLNDGTDPYRPFEPCINYSNTYLLTIEPSTLESTRTDSDMLITVNYLNHQNINQSVSYQLNNWLEDMYMKNNSIVNGTYLPQNMNRTINFLMEIRDVKTFLSVTISLSDQNKSYQFESVSIHKVKNIDHQIYYSLSGPDLNADQQQYIGNNTFTVITKDRNVDIGDLISKVSKTTYLANASTSKTLDFIDYSTGEPVDQRPSTSQGLTAIKPQMSYNEINQDLKLSSVRSTYEIHVNVSSIADAGSSNYFFFQLVFENGTSGVVLANEQIAGDAFRQGETSAFTIMTNQYYGQPKSIRIYTHSSYTEDNNTFDKLNISSIEIIRQSGSGLSTSWTIENVGWIDINYTEEDVSGLATKMNNASNDTVNNTSICREYYVTKNTAAMDFMVEFEVARNTATTDPHLTALVSYRKTTGAVSSINLNVNQEVDKFNGVSGATYVPGQMSRFYLSLNDVESISQIRFESDKNENFILQNLRIYRVSERGDVYLDSNGRYNREGELTPITYGSLDTPMAGNLSKAIVVNLAANQNMNVTFQTGQDGSTSFTTGTSVQTNVAESLNLYVFPGTNTNFRSRLYGALKYTGTYQSGYMQKSLVFEPDDKLPNGAMVLRNLSINNLGSIYSLTLSSEDSSNPSVSHVIIERVNNKRKVKTYNIDFQSYYLISPVQAFAGNDENEQEMKQTVTITTNQIDPIRLSKANDIGVAIKYKSEIDDSIQYISDYVYLSEQAKNSLSKGDPVTATLYEQNVGEILGVSIITTGSINLNTDTVYVCNYNQFDELLYATGIARPLSITPESGNINQAVYHDTTGQNPATVMPVTFTFRTAEDTTLQPVAGTYSKIYATLICQDPNNDSRTVEIYLGNIRDYFSKNNTDFGALFQSGKTDSFTAYLYNTGTPLELKLTMNENDNDPWTLTDVSVKRSLPDGTYETKSGAGTIVSAAEENIIDLRTISAEEQIMMQQPTPEPTPIPTPEPTPVPTPEPTSIPTIAPSIEPSSEPSTAPTLEPSVTPSTPPTQAPSSEPSQPPAAEETLPPSSPETSQPPASGGTSPSSPETSQSPASGETSPSSPETSQPPASGGTSPSSPETSQPPASGETSPSSPETSQSPASGGTSPSSSEASETPDTESIASVSGLPQNPSADKKSTQSMKASLALAIKPNRTIINHGIAP